MPPVPCGCACDSNVACACGPDRCTPSTVQLDVIRQCELHYTAALLHALVNTTVSVQGQLGCATRTHRMRESKDSRHHRAHLIGARAVIRRRRRRRDPAGAAHLALAATRHCLHRAGTRCETHALVRFSTGQATQTAHRGTTSSAHHIIIAHATGSRRPPVQPQLSVVAAVTPSLRELRRRSSALTRSSRMSSCHISRECARGMRGGSVRGLRAPAS